ncbi:WbuC family cupin fold metalloprotein [Thiogranum longum]
MKILTVQLLDALSRQAAAAPRLRTNHNIHPALDDPVQRFFNAMHPGTYVRPHRHTEPPRWELFMAVRGRLALLLFDDEGRVVEREELAEQGPVFGAEVEPGRWHALVAFEPTILFELKQGPYSALTDKDFAGWAPVEGAADCDQMLNWYRDARPGDRSPFA